MNLIGMLQGAGVILASRRNGSPPGDHIVEEKQQTIVEHLAELRTRLIWSALTVVVTTGTSFVFREQMFAFVMVPAGGIKLVAIEVTETLGAVYQVSIYS